MDYKSRQHPGKGWLTRQSQQGQRPVGKFNRDIEVRLPRTAQATGAAAVLDEPRSGLREMLQSSNCQLALVTCDQDDDIRALQEELFSMASPPVLLPFRWKELIARVCEFVRDASLFGDCRVIWLEDVCINFSNREARRSSGEPITVTNQEFKTLQCFLLNPGRCYRGKSC
jgi:hypothetical protein